MADTVSPDVRSRMMRAIRGQNTQPELAIRRGLHALGFRYSLHRHDLPGRPDIVLPKYKAVIWVHGCYWHGHDCGNAKLPSSNQSYWHPKINRTQQRDLANRAAVDALGWRSLTIWECCLRGSKKVELPELLEKIATWIRCGNPTAEIREIL